MYEVVDNWLYVDGKSAEKIPSKVNKFSEGSNICDFLIMHYTASTTARSAHNNFQNPDTQVSWHLTVDRDGKIYQLYDFRKIVWHAGKSEWGPYKGMNQYSIGIEIVNAGPLSLDNGAYKTWSKQTVPDMDVFTDSHGNGWMDFTPEQLRSVELITRTLCVKYKIKDILGHNDISPGRKVDPGPAFVPFMNHLRQMKRSLVY